MMTNLRTLLSEVTTPKFTQFRATAGSAVELLLEVSDRQNWATSITCLGEVFQDWNYVNWIRCRQTADPFPRKPDMLANDISLESEASASSGRLSYVNYTVQRAVYHRFARHIPTYGDMQMIRDARSLQNRTRNCPP
ncbi:hypothetical protein Mapa_006975 [Marchantia paleacea]|nr:hypothetical protein Mapa_006975 [Marchantia paleacea]